jgi:aerobic-type carbon monoxide dehydrogenase small subunit (CoxS/CutS family)
MATRRELNFCINGVTRTVQVEPRRTLLDCIRNDLGLTGTKRVCDMGDCGACTVLLDGKAVYACLVLALDAQDHEVITIEGIETVDGLDAIQQAFLKADAYQCGFCTPGQIMSLKACFVADPQPSTDDLLRALSGNLCRCGAYQHLVQAAQSVAGRANV